MSFRARLTLFFFLIVIVPMVSLTVVLFRLIADNENGKADASIAARQRAAIGLYYEQRKLADTAAVRVGKDLPLATAFRADDVPALRARALQLLKKDGLKRVVIVHGRTPVVDLGAGNAVFPALRQLDDLKNRPIGSLAVSVTGPRDYAARAKALTGLDVVLHRGAKELVSTKKEPPVKKLPDGASFVTINGQRDRAASFSVADFSGGAVQVSLVDPKAGTDSKVRSSRILAAAILLGFFILAFTFALLVSRSLQRQIAGFLEAAQRLGGGDFTTKVPTVGRDEFAALGEEFNSMSAELERRLEELRQEQARLATAMRRIGETFASNLDRDALLEIVLNTALDGTAAQGGRARVGNAADALTTVAEAGTTDGIKPALAAAEEQALTTPAPVAIEHEGVHAIAHPLRRGPSADASENAVPSVSGVVSLARSDREFSTGERDLFDYLAGQASVSVENVGLHEVVERQAVTDELTGLSNRRRFQDVLATEVERSRRFNQPVSLVMLDIDNFKKVNDTYGHQQGDLVIREVAGVLHERSREIDEPARYGGEELAVVLPGTDLEGAHQLAERVREGIEALVLPLIGGDGTMRVTASLGAATHPDSAEDTRGLVAAADEALYEAKRSGKNRTVSANGHTRTPG